MPYMVVHEGDNFDVFKKGPDGQPEGKRLGQHPSQKEADDQIGAISAREDQKALGRKTMLYRQEEAGYVPVSTTPGQMCAGCRWFCAAGSWDDDGDGDNDCHLVDEWPVPIMPTGWCRHYEALPVQQLEPQPMPVVIVEPDADDKALSNDTSTLRKALKSLLRVFGVTGPEADAACGFKLLDNGEWFGWWSNNRTDREDEVFAYKAHEAYVRLVKSGEWPMPVLDYWHIPGTEHGRANWVGMAGEFTVAKGTFDDTPDGRGFRAFYQSRKAWQMSHEFLFPPSAKQQGVYYAYYTKKLSVLPPWAAANPYTAFEEAGMKMVTDEQYKDLVAALGETKANQIKAQAETMSKALDDAGIGAKAAASAVLPVEDAQARKALEALDAGQKTTADAVLEMAKAVKELRDDKTATDARLTAIEGSVKAIKEILAGAPRASTSPHTEVTPDSPMIAFLQKKEGENGRAQKSILEQLMEGQTVAPTTPAPAAQS